MKSPLSLFDNLSEWGNLKPGLERVERVLKALGNPHMQFPHILVGGTNGKGTVSSNLAAALPGRVGLFLSPHVYDIRERICIDGRWVEDVCWQWAHEYICLHAEKESNTLSYFEWLLVLACVIFRKKGVDHAVFEVGVGGLLDATNALDPHLSVVTNVGLDHQALLGQTIEEIAVQKLGIGRPNKPFLIPEDVLGYRLARDFCVERELKPQTFVNKGVYQDNISLVSQVLSYMGLPEQWQRVTLPGRREYENIGKGIFYDGAHNVKAWICLAEWYKENISFEKCNLVAAITEGRNADSFLKCFSEISSEIYLFDAGYDRELSMSAWPDTIRDARQVGISHLLERPLLVCGSLYLIAPFKHWLQSEMTKGSIR